MTTTAVLRLLNYGLPGLRSAGERAAEAFSPNELAASPLALDAPPADLSGDVDASSENDWRETSPDGDLHLLERPWPGLHAPLYLAGHATSSLDVAQALAHRNLLPEWGAVLVLAQSAGRGQLRRAWASPPGNIYAALRLPTAWPLNTEVAATAVGGLFASALTQLGYAVSLKWPNDILQVQNEEFSTSPDGVSVRPCSATAWVKAGGILLEERGGVLLAGVGLNISSAPPASALREGFALPAGVLRHAPAPPPCAGRRPYRNSDRLYSAFTFVDAACRACIFLLFSKKYRDGNVLVACSGATASRLSRMSGQIGGRFAGTRFRGGAVLLRGRGGGSLRVRRVAPARKVGCTDFSWGFAHSPGVTTRPLG